jgi:hypothetical protein
MNLDPSDALILIYLYYKYIYACHISRTGSRFIFLRNEINVYNIQIQLVV